MSTPLEPLPIGPLQNFPARYLRRGTTIFRAHLVTAGPWQYSSSPLGPFDLAHPRATLYASTEPGHSLRELLVPIGGRHQIITEAQIRRFVVTPLRVKRGYRLATVDHAKARQFDFPGVARLVAAGFPACRRWAEALAANGFDGIAFTGTSADSARATGLALFRDADRDSAPRLIEDGEPIDGEATARAAGFRIAPDGLRSHIDLL